MRKSLIVVLMASILVLSGCAQIPTDSLVQVGTDITSTSSSDYTYYSPNGPSTGDGQTEILNGFLNAFTGPQDDYLVARQFLVSKLAGSWDPTKRLLIENSHPTITYQGTDQVTVTVNVSAAVDAEGQYQTYSSAKNLTLKYQFAKEHGEWRISVAPDATVLVRPVFDVLFKSYNLYFYDQQSRYLVPDLRWFPTRPSTGTRLVSALLAGPSNWLAKSAHNAFPNGTKLALDSVPIVDGTAVVDLNASASKATADQLQHMLAQLNATLTQVNSVYGTVIRIDHVPQSIVELPYRLALASNSSPYVLANSSLTTISGNNPLSAVNASVKSLLATDFAVNNQVTQVALLGPTGVSIVKNYAVADKPVNIDSRPGLLRPAIDPQGYTFTLGVGRASTLKAFDTTGKSVMVTSGWLSQYTHLAFAISKEGSRIAFAMRDGEQTKLMVAAIIRDYQGKPIGIADPMDLLNTSIIGSGIGWVGENSVGLITAADGLIATPTIVTIGGDVQTLLPLLRAVEYVSPSSDSSSYVLDSEGSVWQLRGFSWQKVKLKVSQIHF